MNEPRSGDIPTMASGHGSLSEQVPGRGTVGEVFTAFLKLGVTSFGGPIAHLGYFRQELVIRRRWLDEATFADLVALCQFLPGPASSQVGFSLGVLRGNGLLGGLAAWLAFTLPSAAIHVRFRARRRAFHRPGRGRLSPRIETRRGRSGRPSRLGHGEKPDAGSAARRNRAGCACGRRSVHRRIIRPIAAIVLGACAGLARAATRAAPISGRLNFPVIARERRHLARVVCGAASVVAGCSGGQTGSHALALFDAFYRSGALVFGGGHVVLPLLQAEVVTPGWVSNEAFLAGYGLAQAVRDRSLRLRPISAPSWTPRPMVLPAQRSRWSRFLPGLLLVYGMLPFWDALRTRPIAQAAMRGTNAAVVGILGAALYHPVWTGAVMNSRDFALALTGFLLLAVWKLPSWMAVVLLAAAGTLSSLI